MKPAGRWIAAAGLAGARARPGWFLLGMRR